MQVETRVTVRAESVLMQIHCEAEFAGEQLREQTAAILRAIADRLEHGGAYLGPTPGPGCEWREQAASIDAKIG